MASRWDRDTGNRNVPGRAGVRYSGRIPCGGKMQRNQRGRPRRRQHLEGVDAVEMDQVDGFAVQDLADGMPMPEPRAGLHGVGEFAIGRYRNEFARDLRALARDDQRAVTRRDQRPVYLSEHLLGAARSIGTDRGERIGHREDRHPHCGASGNPARRRASRTASMKRSPVMPQPIALVEQPPSVGQAREIRLGSEPEQLDIKRDIVQGRVLADERGDERLLQGDLRWCQRETPDPAFRFAREAPELPSIGSLAI